VNFGNFLRALGTLWGVIWVTDGDLRRWLLILTVVGKQRAFLNNFVRYSEPLDA
jgi:hypothetical protein